VIADLHDRFGERNWCGALKGGFMKVVIVYHSRSGHALQLARAVEEGVKYG